MSSGGALPTSVELGNAIVARCNALAALTEEPGVLTRTYLTPMHKAANDMAAGWMREAGMTTRTDAIGNVIGRYEGARAGARAVIVGSHLDTVRNAGRFDGMLGVVTGIAAVEALHRAGRRLPFAIEVVGFGDEEGSRFDATLIGSRAMAGTLPPAALETTDAEGVTVARALGEFGLDPRRVEEAAKRPEDVLAYLEVHIEQGPVLEKLGLPLGAVTAICGATRRRYRVVGEAGHAGTVPMAGRRDAFAGAAEIALAVEEVARTHGIVATIGRMAVEPGTANVIPGAAAFTLDLRAERDDAQTAALDDLDGRVAAVAMKRGLAVQADTYHDSPACTCDPALMALFERAIARVGQPVTRLPSGAGHDAMAIAAIAPVGMLFLRCKGGISHNPAEDVIAEDVGLAAQALMAALDELGRTGDAA